MIVRRAKGLALVLGFCALAGVATIARHGPGSRRASPFIVSVLPRKPGYSTPPAAEPSPGETEAPVADGSGIPALEGVPLLASLNGESLPVESDSQAYEIPPASAASSGSAGGRSRRSPAGGGGGDGPGASGTGAAMAPNGIRPVPGVQTSGPPPEESQPGASSGGASERTGINLGRRPGPEPESFNWPPPPTRTGDDPAPWLPDPLQDPRGVPPGNTTTPGGPIPVPPGAQVLPEQPVGGRDGERFDASDMPVPEPPTWLLTALACILFCGRPGTSKSPVRR